MEEATHVALRLLLAIIICGVFVQYIDVQSWLHDLSIGGIGYHLFIILLYFAFFLPILLLRPSDWELFLVGGLGVGLFNDITFGFFSNMWVPQYVPSMTLYYYNTWFRDINTQLFTSMLAPLPNLTITTGILWVYTVLRLGIAVYLWLHWVDKAGKPAEISFKSPY